MKVQYSHTQAVKYSKFAEGAFSWNFLEKQILKKHLEPVINSDKKILDAGCGTGRSTQLIVKLGAKEDNIIGTDVSSEMLNIAKESIQNIKFVRSDLAQLNLKNESVDIIVSNMVLHYLSLKELKAVTSNFYKWLTPGGYLLYVVVHPFRFKSNYDEYFVDSRKIEKTPWGTRNKYFPKKISDYINATINSGFELISVEEPIPVKTGRKVNPKEYKKYSTIPTRLVIKAKK